MKYTFIQKNKLEWGFLLFILLENCFLFYFKQNGLTHYFLNALLLLLSSIGIGLLLLIKFRNKIIVAKQPSTNNAYPVFVIAILGVLYYAYKSHLLFLQFPININSSDIIPTLQLMVKRFMHGEAVYAPLSEFHYSFRPTYLPATWFPYIVASLFSFDYRWVAFAIWAMGVLLFAHTKKNENVFTQFLGVFLFFAVYQLIIDHDFGTIVNTIEIMIAGYYMFLIWSINKGNFICLGLSIVLCILSRFSFILWLPLAGFILARSDFKLFKKTLLVVIIGLAIGYVFPFLIKNLHGLTETLGAYKIATLSEWNHLDETGLPFHLTKGIGFAYYFYQQGFPNELPKMIAFLQQIQLIVLTLFSVLFFLFYLKNRSRYDYRILLLSSLKIYLSLFFAFLIIPYVYLMIVGNFLSIGLFLIASNYSVEKKM